ncbi:MAG: D-2-hydroxyacid dehydrogenase [Planctomycetes bacterium]|nr:D-2-hydroxyacid dehydrogenase [Planctomycetota bacterium]
MRFKLVICPPTAHDDWPERIRKEVPDCEVVFCRTVEEAKQAIADADAAFGDVRPDLFARAKKLKWIQAHYAGLGPEYFHEALVKSPVTVTNMRGIYNDHLANMALSYLLAFARGLHHYFALQQKRQWGPTTGVVCLSDATAGIIGVGGVGAEIARLCKAFRMRVIGVDPRREDKPEGCDELWRADRLDEMLPQSDFVIMTCPETPDTLRMMNARRFGLMKRTAYFINVSRARNVVADDLLEALKAGTIAGAALDVTEPEPLPPSNELWGMPNVIITPHMGAAGPYLGDRRTEVFLDNCRRFSDGRPLRNIVDKAKWF